MLIVLNSNQEPERPERPALLDLHYKVIFVMGAKELVLIYSTNCVPVLTLSRVANE